ncbi:basic leucine zipper 43-like [Magnolia sinica]|uniref:basic leucine zipper 43-like n=1 Tax=Magnolia sinica TaxID=86752 RepID=UPI0026583A9D|nr:basic leucine zipper 43-like [Magnolia sinica]
MHPGEVAGMRYLQPVSPPPYPAHFSAMQNNMPAFHYNSFLRPYPTPTFHMTAPVHEFAPQTPSLSNNSTSDEADELQMSVIDERKQRRMISNRESARRSRMRKQKHLDELWSQVLRLRTENRQLIDKLNHVSECHDRVLHENERLREEASDLRRTLQDLQLDDPYTVLREMEEVPCNTAHLRAESTNQPVTSSMNLLH